MHLFPGSQDSLDVIHYGMLINILHKELGEREVVFASVLPLNQKEAIEVSINKIRKMETN